MENHNQLPLTYHLLPADDASPIGLHYDIVKSGRLDYAPDFGFDLFDTKKNFQHKPYHIYLCSTQPIKERDYGLRNDNVIVKVSEFTGESERKSLKKIEFTTNPKLISDGVSALPKNVIIKSEFSSKPDRMAEVNFFAEFCKRYNNKDKGVDVEKLAEEKYPTKESLYPSTYYSVNSNTFGKRVGFQDGYNQCLQDNADKKFTFEDLHNIMNLGMSLRQDQLNGHSSKSGNEVLNDYIQSITQNSKGDIVIECEMQQSITGDTSIIISDGEGNINWEKEYIIKLKDGQPIIHFK